MSWLLHIALAADHCPPVQAPTGNTEQLMADAETWYWWARASGDDLRLHCLSLRAFELAEGPAAEAGAEAAWHRVDNSFDSVRNVYPLVWWMLVEDPVAEGEDGPGELPDHYQRAIQHGWETPARVLDDHETPRINAWVRCQNSPYCQGLREAASKLVDAHPRLQTIPDEVAQAQTEDLEPEALMEAFELDELLVLDLDLRDIVEVPREAVRIDLTARILPELTPVAVSTGIGVNHVPSRQLDVLFGLVLLLAALARDNKRWRGVLVGSLVGGVYGWFASSWAPFVPPMDAVALTPGGLLRLETFLWPLATGALMLLGPPLVVGVGLLTVGRRLPSIGDRFSLQGLVPGAQAGALTVVLAPVCEGLHWSGVLAALSIGLPAVLASGGVGGLLQRVLDGRPEGTGLSLGAAAVGLPLLFPVGLMGRWWIPVLIVGGAIAAFCEWAPRRRQAASPTRVRRATSEGGTLRQPRWVGGGQRELARLVDELERPQLSVLVIEGAEGVGKTRLSNELRRRLQARGDWRVGVGQAEARLGEVGATAFGLISQAMAQVLEAESAELAAVHGRRAALTELAGAAGEAALEMLPGVGVLLSLGEAQDTTQITLDRMRRDLVSSLLKVAADQPLMLIFDDIQWGDESSIGLLEHVRQTLADPEPALRWPVVLVLLQRPGPGPHLRLSAPDDRLVLTPFPADGVERLLSGAGVSASAEFAQLVRERVGGSPRHVLELVAELDAAGLLERDEGGLVVPPSLGRAAVERAVPRHLRDLEMQRLSRLDEADLVLLHASAQCGRRFDVGALAEGMQVPRIELLSQLWRIDRRHDLLEDLDDDESFRFRTELMRSVLVDLARRADGRGVTKLLKEFHWNVVLALLERDGGPAWSELRDSERVVRHAVLAGERAESHVVRYATRAAANAARRCAWPEAMEWVQVARQPDRADSGDGASTDRLDLVEAKVLNGLGGEKRGRALELLRGLVESEFVDQLEVVLLWFETAFELRTRSSVTELLAEIHTVRGLVDTQGRQTLVEAVCDFYQVLAEAEDRGVRPGPDPLMAQALGQQAEALRAVTTERGRERDLLLARILQAKAQREEDQAAYLAASRESLALKERHGDLAGQALTKGMLGNYFLWWAPVPDPAEARRWLEEDLEVVERMGATSALSSLHNRIALSYAMEGDHERALSRALQALGHARRNAQGADLLFAAFAVFEHGLSAGALEQVDELGKQLVAPPADWPW